MTGTQISELQDTLARIWKNHGPEQVYSVVGDWDKSVLEQFVMANIGKRASDLEQA